MPMKQELVNTSTNRIAHREYWCFISYRHADNKQPGRQWASWLHHSLETYEVPADLIGTTNDRGEMIPDRIYPVFRDEEELPADAQLSRPIERAIQQSKFMIVLCSPHAVVSRFVYDEIVRFKTHRPANKDNILAVIIAGDPAGEEVVDIKEVSEIPYSCRQCFPRPIRFVVAADGVVTETPAEPISPDFRLPDNTEGFTSPAAYREFLGSSATEAAIVAFEKRLEQMKLKIIAGILGIPLGILTARDKAYQLARERARMRTLRQWLATVALFAVLAIIGGLVALKQRSVAVENESAANRNAEIAKQNATEARKNAQRATIGEAKATTNEKRALEQLKEASRSDLATAQEHLENGEWQKAVAYLSRAMRYDPENQEAQDALWIAATLSKNKLLCFPAITIKQEYIIVSMAFNPTGDRILAIGENNTVYVWDVKTGLPDGAPIRLPEKVNSAQFSPDGRRIVTASADTAQIWEVNTGKAIGQKMVHETIEAAIFSPDGKQILTTADNSIPKLWDGETGAPNGEVMAVPEAVRSANYSRDGRQIVTASYNEDVRIWSVSTRKMVGSPMRIKNLESAQFSPDGKNIVVTLTNTDKQIWDAKTRRLVSGPINAAKVNGVDFSADGTRLLTTSDDGAVQIWDAGNGQPVGESVHLGSGIMISHFSPDGTRIFTACGYDSVFVNQTGFEGFEYEIKHHDIVPDGDLRRFVYVPSYPCLSPDGAMVATTGFDKTIRIWNSTSSQAAGTAWAGIVSAKYSRDGSRIVTVNTDGCVRVCDASNGDPIGSPILHPGGATIANFSPDGTRIITGGADNIVRIWSAYSGQPAMPGFELEGELEHVVFSPDGKLVATATSNTAQVWDTAGAKPTGGLSMTVNGFVNVGFSQDGTSLFTADAFGVIAWDPKDRIPPRGKVKFGEEVFQANLGGARTHVITVSDDNYVRVWDLRSGRSVGSKVQHLGFTNSAELSLDGTRIVTTGDETWVRIWDLPTGRPIGPVLEVNEGVLNAEFSPDGTQIASISANGDLVRILDVRSRQRLQAKDAKLFAACISGAQLNPLNGAIEQLSIQERLLMWKELDVALVPSPDWRFAAGLVIPRDPETAPASPRGGMTVRQVATNLIKTMISTTTREALSVDPGHPLIPFAFAAVEIEEMSNPLRAKWLIAYGIEHLPRSISADDLRLAARLVAKVVNELPEHKAVARSLLDRAAILSSEDEETQMLRDELK